MKKTQINYDDFMKYPSIKPGVVHVKDGVVYKHAPNSEELVSLLYKTSSAPVFKHTINPIAKLYIEDFYFGYTYNFNKELHLVEDARALKIIKDINIFAKKLLSIVKELNELNLYYWDFHQNNILVNQKGEPFLIDIDDMVYNPTNLSKYHQVKYLTEFLLNLYLSQDKTISQFLRTEAIQQYFSKETIYYISTLIGRTGNIYELPHCVINELENSEKTEFIKSKIK